MQHFLNLRPEPQGQMSFRPSFSVSSLSSLTTLSPRFTLVSDGYPFLRLLVISKAQRLSLSALCQHGAPPLVPANYARCPFDCTNGFTMRYSKRA
jgi:hypothetical protein